MHPQSICSIPDCDRKHYARGWCNPHYQRFRVHGDPLGGGPARWVLYGSPEERFWPKVDKNGSVPECAPHLGSCWLWLAGCDHAGYGEFWTSDRMFGAHRWAYEQEYGPVPEGLELDHLCRIPRCVRPSHLEPVTHAENMARMAGPRV